MGQCCCNTPDGGLGIWGPPGPWPTPPIYWPGFPALPGGSPPLIWGGGNVPMPTPPIWNVPGAGLPPDFPVDPPPTGINGPLPETYPPPTNDGTNYFSAKPGVVLPTGPVAYLVMPIWPGEPEGVKK